jgi:hypothetical protein
MKVTKSLPSSLFLLFAIAAPCFAAEDAQTVISRYIEAIGGRAAIEKVRTQVTKGTFALPEMGIYAPFETYLEPPDKSYMHIDFTDVSPASNGVNGDIAWQIHPMTGAQILKGEDRLAALRGAEIDPLVDWKKYYKTAEVTGHETIAGQSCTQVTFTPETGANLIVYFNDSTHLLVRMIGIQGGMKAQTDISDYRDTGALKQPYRLKVTTPQFSFEFQVDSIEQNVPIPPEKFALPPEIQRLVEQ